ncbi:hypothetical protein HHI36_022928 [Cryptolaemus montrouzieri]|uniref:Uncharacterized protein n=1 Tax=Cryptolaemus montrouzieri TaxID=559131 RepID=A0ABD2PFF9_9CUCU
MVLKVLVFFVCFYSLVNIVAMTKCYVCGIENEHCEFFDASNDSFVMNCPPNKSSCGLQTIGEDVIVRSCEDLAVNDCQKANNVKYCYCTRDLCNGLSIAFTPSDDEDDIEGSGTTIPTITLNPQVTLIPKFAKGNQERSTPKVFFLYLLYFISPLQITM